MYVAQYIMDQMDRRIIGCSPCFYTHKGTQKHIEWLKQQQKQTITNQNLAKRTIHGILNN